jgi:ankyrin repeat protein
VSQNGNLEIVKYLVNHGADINKSNALYASAEKGHENIVKCLIEHGADVNKQNENRTTPLGIAKSKLQTPTFSELQKQKYQEIISYLISKGAYTSGKIVQPIKNFNRKY